MNIKFETCFRYLINLLKRHFFFLRYILRVVSLKVTTALWKKLRVYIELYIRPLQKIRYASKTLCVLIEWHSCVALCKANLRYVKIRYIKY